jgi:hypothetical protein
MKMQYGHNTIARKALGAIGAAIWLFCSSGVALSATVGFAPSPSLVSPGDTFSLDVVGIGFTDPLAGGTFDIGFDDTLVQINSVSVNVAVYEFLPDGGSPISPGLWGTVGFDTFFTAPTGDITIATINLTALGAGTSELLILNSEFFDDTVNQLSPTLAPGVISSVPVPAAVWLFGSGLFALFGLSRRRSA